MSIRTLATRRLERRPAGRLRRVAFTLVELLVVIAIILVAVAVTLPAVARIIESNNFASAVNAVTATLGNARALAMGNSRHTAVAFLFNVETRRYSLVVLEEAPGGTEGKLTSCFTQRAHGPGAAAYIPAAGATPVPLPRNTAVFGLSFAIPTLVTDDANRDGLVDAVDTCFQTATEQWYAGEIFESPDNRDLQVTPWLFPRNDPRIYLDDDPEAANPLPAPPEEITLEDLWLTLAGEGPDELRDAVERAHLVAAMRHAMTFAVVFSPDGSVTNVFDRGERLLDAYLERPLAPRDPDPASEEQQVYDDPRLFDPELINPRDPTRTTPNPEVRLRAAVQLAVVDLNALAAGTRVEAPWGLHSSRSFSPGGPLSSEVWPPFRDEAGDELQEDELNSRVQAVSDWIDGNAQILTFNRYTGRVVKR